MYSDPNQPQRHRSQGPAPSSGVGANVATMAQNTRSISFATTLLLSVLFHALFVGTVAGGFALAAFFGLDLSGFDPLAMKPRDIQFVLVSNPEQQPLNKNTKNRAERATRAGGEKTNQPEAEAMKKAGSPTPRPKPKPVAKPSPKPQPKKTQVKKVAQKPTPKPKPTPKKPKLKKIVQKPTPKPKAITKAPPRPSLPKPVKRPTKRPTLPPNPIAPTIKTPAPPSPKYLASAGPIINSGSMQSKGSRTSGPVAPSQIPGSTSRGSRSTSTASSGRPSRASTGNPGWSQGRGGRGSYNQSGSPGGGPGRPGIDALPDPDYGAYMAELQRRIKRNWRPPTAQEDKRVRVLFKIGLDGRLTHLVVEGSSGYPEADQAALAAVKLSAPFRRLPAGHRDSDLAVQFTFDYNVYKNSGSFSARRRP